jgi:hypothetical protein
MYRCSVVSITKQEKIEDIALCRRRFMGAYFIIAFAIMMEAVRISETSVHFKEITRGCIPEGCHRNTCHRDVLKSA